MSKSVNSDSDSDFFSRFEQVVFLHSSLFQSVAKLPFFCTNVSHYFFKREDFYVEKGLPLKFFFSKKYIVRKCTNPVVWSWHSCAFVHIAKLVSPFLGFPCINAMHFPSYEFSVAILAYSVSLPGFDVIYFVFVLRKKAMFYYFSKAS